MRTLHRIQVWAERRKVDVFLQQMFCDVEWNAYPALHSNRKGVLTGAPYSLEDFAEGFAPLADHLLRVAASSMGSARPPLRSSVCHSWRRCNFRVRTGSARASWPSAPA